MFKRSMLIALIVMTVLSASALPSLAHDDIKKYRDCKFCGMDRKVYGYSRMLIKYADGGESGVCSLHCAITELDAAKGKKVLALLVADRNSHKLLEAEKAVWVLGGKKRGVMTARAKWAFAAKTDAEQFVKNSGGEIVSWDQALQAAREDAAQKPGKSVH